MGVQSVPDYSVKNTFVEIPVPPEDAEFSRAGQRAMTEGAVMNDAVTSKGIDDYLLARTPSPFMHPAQAPTDPQMMALLPLPGPGYDAPIAFGDFELNGFDDADNQNNFNPVLQYDPSSGMYMGYDWSMQFGPDCYNMMGDMSSMEGNLGGEYGCMPYEANNGMNHTSQLLQALSEKISAGRDPSMGQPGLTQDCPEGVVPLPLDGYDLAAPLDGMDGSPANMDVNGVDGYGNALDMQVQQPRSEGGGRKGRNRDRDRSGRGERAGQDMNASPNTSAFGTIETEGNGHQGPVNFTTVMFRNIPNKYTREMLVKQLEQELKGEFDFVYLPIDFKNQCNVGYAFINFRSIQACEIFMMNFNGVEVRKCLPGLNSRKVTEVTPARVQGFEDNVQRLRNSPVMRELSHHPEWMPLIFDTDGIQIPFPTPERPLEPIKPRRRARDEAMAGAGA